jgi:hypothetical protein
MIKRLVVLGFLMASLTQQMAAQGRDRTLVAGLRSGLISGPMKLSQLDAAFGDLANDGPSGPHMSGFFLLVPVRSHLRLGVETLVGNSDQKAATTMNYQAAGPVVDVTYGEKWFVSGGMHVGGVIVNAMARADAAPATGATRGSYFKANGGFVAPYIDAGYRYRRSEIGGYVKRVGMFGAKDRGGLSPFSATFVGVRLGIRL